MILINVPEEAAVCIGSQLLFYVYRCFTYMYVCAPCVYAHAYVYAVASEARRGPQSLWNWSYRWLFQLSYYVGARNQARVLLKSNQCS